MKPLRIVLTGSECTGKSTLAEQLGLHYKVETVPEYLREYFEQKNGSLSIEDTIPIAKGQLEAERLIESKGYNPLINDTDALSSVIYARHYFGRCPEFIEEILNNRHCDLYILCGTDIKWQADGQRDRPEQREYMQGLFRNELITRKLNFIEITGSADQRFDIAVKAIDSLLG